jgi:hypothetical protein
MNINKITITSAAAMAGLAASVEDYAVSFNLSKGTNHFPAPRRIKSIVSIYNSSRDGTLKSYNYPSDKGEPRPSWTYRTARRNVARDGNLLTKAV